jgi:hypothetical protein
VEEEVEVLTTQGSRAETLRDLTLAWVAIQEAIQGNREAELGEIAVSLYGQLGEAKAELRRLRAALHAALRGCAPAQVSS